MGLDVRQVMTSLIIAGVIASLSTSVGAIWDFQNLKQKVEKHEAQLDVIGTVVCEYAIRDSLPNSSQKCASMLRGK